MYRVAEDLELAVLPKDVRGVFFSWDCYVLDYAYGDKDNESRIIYFWQVRGSNFFNQSIEFL